MYLKRLNELDKIASEHNIRPATSESKNDFFEFLSKLGFSTKTASLTLSDNGILRATWRKRWFRVSINFCGGSQVKYILASPHGNSLNITSTINEVISDCEFMIVAKTVMKN